jgi:methyl-accepting chemotaxis protein
LKLLVSMIPVMALCFVVLLVQGRETMDAGFGRIELEAGEQRVAEITDALGGVQRTLLQLTRLQSVWDDPYEHLLARDTAAFAEDYPPSDMWNAYRIGALAVVDTAGQFVGGGTTADGASDFGSLPDWLDAATIAGPTGEGYCGFWGTDQLYVGCAHPVLHADGSGDPAGWLAMFQPIDDQLLAELSGQIGTELRLSPGVAAADVTIVDADTIDLAAQVSTNSGAAFSVETTLPRTVMREATATRKHIERTILLVMAAFTAALVVVFELLVLRRIGRVSHEIGSIAASGDTTSRLTAGGSDELGRLARATNDMLTVLAEHEVAAHAAHEDARRQLDAAEHQLSDASHRQDLALRSHDDALRLVTDASTQILGHLGAVADTSDELASSVGEISGLAADTTSITGRAVEAADSALGAVSAMRHSAETIEQVAAFIASVAEETNLLALNASIEAARAGVAGAGFAVVAEEVKQLARKTAESTKAITVDIASMRSRVEAIDHSVTDLATLNSQVDRAAAGIAASTARQRRATNDVSQNLSAAIRSVEDLAHSR